MIVLRSALMLTLPPLHLKCSSKLFLVFLSTPLGAIGVVAALPIFHAPFGFAALLQGIAVAGKFRRNTVILVDRIDHDRTAGSTPL